MQFSPRKKRLLSGLLAVCLTVTATFSYLPPVSAADSNQVRQDLAALQQKLNTINQQLKDAQSNTANAAAIKKQLEQQKATILDQINLIAGQIGELDNEIHNKEDEITVKERELAAKQAEFDQRWSDFKERMGAMQMLNDGGSIALLSSATNLYQLLTFAQTLEQITAKDQAICQQLEDEHTALEQQKADLEQAKADLEAARASMQEQQDALQQKKNELQGSIQQANEDLTEAQAAEAAAKEAQIEMNKLVDAKAAELDAILNAANKQYGNASITCSLNFGPPLATYKYVSCYFGGNGHRGTDYAAPGGTDIYSIEAGVVTAAAYHYSWGYYVQVYHGTDSNGNSYSTLYAHMNGTPAVSVGQPVSRGTILGHVGSTGYSTGNHLHLEMKVNGVLTNVMNYLS